MNGTDHVDTGAGGFLHEFSARVTLAGSELTPNDVRIVQYFRSHLRDIPFLSADELAEAIGVSRAAVVRFALKLGYPGFAALRSESRRQFGGDDRSPLSRFPAAIANSRSWTEEYNSKCESDSNNLHLTWSNIAATLGDAASDIAKAPQVFIAGNRASYGMAIYLHRLLHYVRARTHLLDPGYPDQIADLTQNDVLVVLLFQRYAAASVRVLERAVRLGATTVAITDGAGRSFVRGVTHLLPVATGSPVLFPSMVGAVSTVEILATHVAQSMPQEASRFLIAKERVMAEEGIFHREPNPSSPRPEKGENA